MKEVQKIKILNFYALAVLIMKFFLCTDIYAQIYIYVYLHIYIYQ